MLKVAEITFVTNNYIAVNIRAHKYIFALYRSNTQLSFLAPLKK